MIRSEALNLYRFIRCLFINSCFATVKVRECSQLPPLDTLFMALHSEDFDGSLFSDIFESVIVDSTVVFFVFL